MPGQDSQELDCARLGRIVSIQTTSERGGAEYAHVDLLTALVARGHDVVLATNAADLTAGTSLRVRELDLGPKLSRRTALRTMLQAPSIILRLARALRAERPVGIVLVHFKKEQLLCSLLPRRLAPAIVWIEWGPVPAQMRRGPARLIYALAARRASKILAVSEGTARTVRETGVPSEKVVVMPDLVNLHRVQFHAVGRVETRRAWKVDERTLVIGCIARFQKRKRSDVLIDAMAYLDGDVLLVLAGEGEEEQALRARAAPYRERVRFVPNVRGHVEEFLSACDLLAFAPSPTEADRPRVIVMAQLIGLPIVATHPEGAEVVRASGGGTIVEPHHDARALADVLRAYRDDPRRRQREGKMGHESILESYDTNKTLQAIESLLQAAL